MFRPGSVSGTPPCAHEFATDLHSATLVAVQFTSDCRVVCYRAACRTENSGDNIIIADLDLRSREQLSITVAVLVVNYSGVAALANDLRTALRSLTPGICVRM